MHIRGGRPQASAPYTHYCADYNTGTNTVFAGGARPSYLLLPVIPAK